MYLSTAGPLFLASAQLFWQAMNKTNFKLSFLHPIVRKSALEVFGYISSVCSAAFIFIDVPTEYGLCAFAAFVLILFLAYFCTWLYSNQMTSVDLSIDSTPISVIAGDIFEQDELKAIAFNEYFDTVVDDQVIAKRTLNGIFIAKHLHISVEELDANIETALANKDVRLRKSESRLIGKKQRYRLGTIYQHEDFLLTAMTRFDKENRAHLEMSEYIDFLLTFWDNLNTVYAQRSVSVPIFGSGITRIKGHKNIGDEDLLKIMLWTFRVSEMRFKYPAKLTIVVHRPKITQVNLAALKSMQNGL